MFRSSVELENETLSVLRPPPRQTVSEWADMFRRLSPEASATPGRWRTSAVEHMREAMDCIGQPSVRRIVIMSASQMAKTELLLNTIGYYVHNDPAPMLLMQPTLEMAEAFSKDRLSPMVRDTSVLRERIADSRSRDSGNTIAHKTFPGGHITMVGANSPSSLASRPIRIVLQDEVDRYPVSAGAEGDPVTLAIKRATTFWNRVVIMTSTPTIAGNSRIEAAFLEGDQRRLWCPCPHCGERQTLKWSSVRWDSGRPETAAYVCEHCGALWSDLERIAAARAGEWRADAPFDGVVSFHMPGLISPFVALADGVREFLEAQGNPERLKTWTNTFLGETWEEKGDKLDVHELAGRDDFDLDDELPEGITALTAGIDVQGDRIEIEVVGWGDEHESWSIDYHVVRGDPSGPHIWADLAEYLKRTWIHPIFGELALRSACIDTGYMTQQVYAFVRLTHGCFAIKGIKGDEGKPVVGKPSRNNPAKIGVFPVGTMTAKELVLARLKSTRGEAGYCNFPIGRDIEFFRQMTAEMLIRRLHRGFTKKEWVKTRPRNEAFDCRVYATVALEILSVDLAAVRRVMLRERERLDAAAEQSEAPEASPKRRRVSSSDSWAQRWRNG